MHGELSQVAKELVQSNEVNGDAVQLSSVDTFSQDGHQNTRRFFGYVLRRQSVRLAQATTQPIWFDLLFLLSHRNNLLSFASLVRVP